MKTTNDRIRKTALKNYWVFSYSLISILGKFIRLVTKQPSYRSTIVTACRLVVFLGSVFLWLLDYRLTQLLIMRRKILQLYSFEYWTRRLYQMHLRQNVYVWKLLKDLQVSRTTGTHNSLRTAIPQICWDMQVFAAASSERFICSLEMIVIELI